MIAIGIAANDMDKIEIEILRSASLTVNVSTGMSSSRRFNTFW
jgi:hypothetical protein